MAEYCISNYYNKVMRGKKSISEDDVVEDE